MEYKIDLPVAILPRLNSVRLNLNLVTKREAFSHLNVTNVDIIGILPNVLQVKVLKKKLTSYDNTYVT